MESPTPGDEAQELIAQLRKGSELLLGTGVNHDLESAVRARLHCMEVRRQENLGAIARGAYLRINRRPVIADQDWLANFVESAKDTGNPILQDIWSKLLAGEMGTPGACSKRTLRMVTALSQAEAVLIKQTCRTVCFIEEALGDKVPFVNVIVQRRDSDFADQSTRHTTLFEDQSDQARHNHRKLIHCGFLANDDFDFSFQGEGYLVPEKFQLSDSSPRQILQGGKAMRANSNQPGLLQEMHEEAARQNRSPRMITPAADLYFSTWKLTPEGEELFQALEEPPDYAIFATLGEACRRGGLALTEE